ncbi:MAG: butyrate kinase [Nitrospirota bacterium]
MASFTILVINPGSTSTKIALFKDEDKIFEDDVIHPERDLNKFNDIYSQLPFRMETLTRALRESSVEPSRLDAVSVRGGLMRPVKSGVYRVTEEMVEDLRNSKTLRGREHASNLGPMMGLWLAREQGIPAFTADPVTVDEMDDVARISGVPEIKRQSLLHALNIKERVRRAARELGLKVEDSNFIAAHMGGGTTVAAIRRGRISDVNNALLGMGPFSPLRAGALPTGDLLDMAYSGRYAKSELERKLVFESGLMGYLGTGDVREAEKRIDTGDETAALILSAMSYQVSKEIGAMAAALSGDVAAVILTGGVAFSERVAGMIRERVAFIAPVLIYPGQAEMEALAWHAAAALSGEEPILHYGQD